MKGNIFIKRPVMAMSIAILIVLVGAISYFSLPLESYPDIAPPTVTVSATYTGASAEAVMKAVIQPLEEGTNGVENMLYMTSTATNSGSASITIYFRQGTNPDMAAVNVQNRVSRVQGLLPSEVTKIGVATTSVRRPSYRLTHWWISRTSTTRTSFQTTSTSMSSPSSSVSRVWVT